MAVERQAGRDDEGVELAEVHFVEVGDDQILPGTGRWRPVRADGGGPLHHRAVLGGPPPRPGEEFFPRFIFGVPCRHFGPAREQRLDRRQPRPSQAVHGVPLAGEGPGGDHLSFSVARPASASTKLMIQKRITTVGSDQPRCSKWWWIGAIRNTRLPVRLYTRTWMTTLSASTTNRPPTIARTNSWCVATETAPSAPPSARLPVSPMNTAAGGALNHRKARQAPIIAMSRIVRSSAPITCGMPK